MTIFREYWSKLRLLQTAFVKKNSLFPAVMGWPPDITVVGPTPPTANDPNGSRWVPLDLFSWYGKPLDMLCWIVAVGLKSDDWVTENRLIIRPSKINKLKPNILPIFSQFI